MPKHAPRRAAEIQYSQWPLEVEIASGDVQNKVVIEFSPLQIDRVVVRRITRPYARRGQRQGRAIDDHRRVEARRICALLSIQRMMKTEVAPPARIGEVRHFGGQAFYSAQQLAEIFV